VSAAHFASVVLDADSTLSGIEGIDWLAARRGAEVARTVVEQTDAAMRGTLPLERVYGERLAVVRPSTTDVDALAEAYVAAVAPGARAAIRELTAAGVRVVMVSGGVKQALLPLARHVGVAQSDVHAVDLRFDAAGGYAGFDATSPLTTSTGKRDVVAAAGLATPILAVGDGRTDVEMKPVVDRFMAYTGFVRRAAVVEVADGVLQSFEELVRLVLG
jgi:phosphoserine phosphatase